METVDRIRQRLQLLRAGAAAIAVPPPADPNGADAVRNQAAALNHRLMLQEELLLDLHRAERQARMLILEQRLRGETLDHLLTRMRRDLDGLALDQFRRGRELEGFRNVPEAIREQGQELVAAMQDRAKAAVPWSLPETIAAIRQSVQLGLAADQYQLTALTCVSAAAPLADAQHRTAAALTEADALASLAADQLPAMPPPEPAAELWYDGYPPPPETTVPPITSGPVPTTPAARRSASRCPAPLPPPHRCDRRPRTPAVIVYHERRPAPARHLLGSVVRGIAGLGSFRD